MKVECGACSVAHHKRNSPPLQEHWGAELFMPLRGSVYRFDKPPEPCYTSLIIKHGVFVARIPKER